MAAAEAIFLLSRAEASDAGDRRRRPAEEKERARDRPGSRAALDQGTRGAYRASQGGDRPPASEHCQQAGLAQCRRPVLQEVGSEIAARCARAECRAATKRAQN